MSEARGLRIRQHERCEIELPVQFIVCDEHSSQVRFSSVSSAVNDGLLQGTSIDISSGGLALASRQFVPRSCEGIVRVFEPAPAETVGDATPNLRPVFEQRAKVRRTRMVSHEPLYKIGLSFIDFCPDFEQKIAVLREAAAHTNENSAAPRGPVNE